MVILFKYTSRSRPELFFRGLGSIVNNLTDKDNYWIVCTFDLDDSTMFNSDVIRRLNTYKNVAYYFGNGGTKTQVINRDLDKLPKFDVLVNFSDDQQFLEYGFDDIIRNDFKSAGSTDWFIHYPDSHAKERLATLSIMGYDYFRRTNTIYHPKFISVYSDNWAMIEAQKLDRYKFINKIIFDHFHPAWSMAEMDDQYRKTENPINYEKDRLTFEELKKECGY